MEQNPSATATALEKMSPEELRAEVSALRNSHLALADALGAMREERDAAEARFVKLREENDETEAQLATLEHQLSVAQGKIAARPALVAHGGQRSFAPVFIIALGSAVMAMIVTKIMEALAS